MNFLPIFFCIIPNISRAESLFSIRFYLRSACKLLTLRSAPSQDIRVQSIYLPLCSVSALGTSKMLLQQLKDRTCPQKGHSCIYYREGQNGSHAPKWQQKFGFIIQIDTPGINVTSSRHSLYPSKKLYNPQMQDFSKTLVFAKINYALMTLASLLGETYALPTDTMTNIIHLFASKNPVTDTGTLLARQNNELLLWGSINLVNPRVENSRFAWKYLHGE